MIKPIIDKIKMKSLIRIKCNMYPSTQKAQKNTQLTETMILNISVLYIM